MDRDYLSSIIGRLDFAMQPIICPRSGDLIAVEALLRNTDRLGFSSISSFFDKLNDEGELFFMDSLLRKKAFAKFSQLFSRKECMLFYNYDPRIHAMPDYQFGNTEIMLEEAGLPSCVICFELSEKHPFEPADELKRILSVTKERGFKIALDDFGVGFSSLEVFYHSEPHYLKFDRFLISGIDRDIKKRSFCSHLLNLAKMLGVVAVAEGIETEQEFAICRDMGFDLVQGFFIQRPVHDPDAITTDYKNIYKFRAANKRNESRSQELVMKEMIPLETIRVDDEIKTLFKKFHRNSENSFFPAVDPCGYPLGIIHEQSIKTYIYSPFGYDLLCNKGITGSLKRFIRNNPVADINTPLDKMLEIFVNDPQSEGIIITEKMKYLGYLTSRSLLNLLHEKNMVYARETNPLTKLPGNMMISRHINESLEKSERYRYLIYFDLNNFKPFNDRFGFRQGDRAILLFADSLQSYFGGSGAFIGHIGGDDFFVCIDTTDENLDSIAVAVQSAIGQFNDGIGSFYNRDECATGFYETSSREGDCILIPLLSASAAVIEICPSPRFFANDELSLLMAEQKKAAKLSKNKISILQLKPPLTQKTAG